RHGICYWGPIDDREVYHVVYRFDCSFPIRAASLYASLALAEAEARGILEVETDLRRGWREVGRGTIKYPEGGQIDISQAVAGSRVIYVRARMTGRDDGKDSAMAQFLRTSILPDGHLESKSSHVFELRVFDREVPILTGSVRFSDGWSPPLW